MAKKRLFIKNLHPNTRYAVQVRTVTDEGKSEWSQKHVFRTVDDTLGGTRKPKTPTLTNFVIDGSGQFVGNWTSVTQNTDDSPLVVKRYEIELAGWDIKPIISHTPVTGTVQSRAFSYTEIRSLYTGIPSSLTMRVRVVNSADTFSDWSSPITASLPVPMPPRNFTATGVINGVSLKWDAPESMANVNRYRVFASVGGGPNFVMNANVNLIYEGLGLETRFTSLSYNEDHHFKIVSISEGRMESEAVTASAGPVSPFEPDDTPPLKPTFGSITIDRSQPGSPKAIVNWIIDETAEDNQDISHFSVRWRRAGDTHWNINYFDKEARAGSIELPYAYANYQFEISAHDWLANFSDYDGTLKTLTAAVAAPAQVSGLTSDARFDGLKLYWNASSSPAVIDGGGYEVQVRSTNSFSGDVADYTTGNTSIDLVLPIGSTRYFRVRAYDTAGQRGPWSTVHSKTLPAFPLPPVSDGTAPSSAPTGVIATGGLNYVNLSWTPITNADTVTYEIYMSTTAAGATATAANLAGTTAGSGLTISSLPNGTPLLRDTTYHFKVRAVDYDGSGPLSAAASTSLKKVISDDLGIDLPGENLYINSSFDTDSDSNGVADFWATHYYPAVSGTTLTPSLVPGRSGGFAQRISWNGPHSSFIGIRSADASVLRPHTEYVLSFYGRASGGTGFGLVFGVNPATGSLSAVQKPVPSATEWNRYIFKFRTADTVYSDNAVIVIQGLGVAGWMEIDDAQIEAGSVVSAYKPGTVSIAKLTTGRFTAADMIISTGGRIASQAYLNNSNTGFAITDAGITIKDGFVDAKTLVAGSTITNTLFVGAKLTVATAGSIGSANYTAPSGTSSGSGYRITSVGIDISSGVVSAGTLAGGVISSPDIRVGANGKITIDSTGSIQSNNYSATTGWKISSSGIEMNDANSKISVKALQTGRLEATAITLGTGGVIKSVWWDDSNVAPGGWNRWKLDDYGLHLIGGTIKSTSIETNAITSATKVFIPGVSFTTDDLRAAFFITAAGQARLAGAHFYNDVIVGTGATHNIQSGNYNDFNGWRIAGNGDAEFKNIKAKSGTTNGVFINIGNRINQYESSADWAVIAMHTTQSTWNPALLWTSTSGTGATATSKLKISSPQPHTSGVPASYISLGYGTFSNKPNMSSISLNATEIIMGAEDYYMGGGSGPVTFRLVSTNVDRRFQFVDPNPSNKRLEIRLSANDEVNLTALADHTTRTRMTLRASVVRLDISSSGTANVELTRAAEATARPILRAPAYDVGLLWATGGASNPGNLQVRTNDGAEYRGIYASNLTAAPSDIRFKKDVSLYDTRTALDDIDSLKIKSYKMVSEQDDRGRLGLIAQEIQEVFPDAVTAPGDGDDRMFVDTYYLLSVVWAGMQETTANMKNMQKEIASLKTQIEDLSK